MVFTYRKPIGKCQPKTALLTDIFTNCRKLGEDQGKAGRLAYKELNLADEDFGL